MVWIFKFIYSFSIFTFKKSWFIADFQIYKMCVILFPCSNIKCFDNIMLSFLTIILTMKKSEIVFGSWEKIYNFIIIWWYVIYDNISRANLQFSTILVSLFCFCKSRNLKSGSYSIKYMRTLQMTLPVVEIMSWGENVKSIITFSPHANL